MVRRNHTSDAREWALSKDINELLLRRYDDAKEVGVKDLKWKLSSLELTSPSQHALFETLLAELGTGGISCRELSDADWELVLRSLWSSAFVSNLLLNQDPTLKSQMPDAPPHALADMGASDWPLRAFTAWTGVLHCIQERYHLAPADNKAVWNLVRGDVDTLVTTLSEALRLVDGERDKSIVPRPCEVKKQRSSKSIISKFDGDSLEFFKILLIILAGGYSMIQASLLTVFVPQNCGGGRSCSIDENLGSGAPLTRTNIAAIVVNFVTLAWLVLTLFLILRREMAIIQCFDVDANFAAEDLLDELDDYEPTRLKIEGLNAVCHFVTLVMVVLFVGNIALSASVILSPEYTLGGKSVTALVNQTLLLAPKALAWCLLSRASHRKGPTGPTFASYILGSAPKLPTRIDRDHAFNPLHGYKKPAFTAAPAEEWRAVALS